jgi:hypothetical protein
MKVTVRVVVQAGDDTGAPSVVREVLSVDRDALAPGTLGLQGVRPWIFCLLFRARWSTSMPRPP